MKNQNIADCEVSMQNKIMCFLSHLRTTCVLGLLLGAFAATNARALDAGDLMNYFVSELTPYGRWSEQGNYGRVWEPTDQSRDWRPYSNGHWVYSDDYGWVWQPEESWGEITYHYGRWGHSNNRWFWVPDRTWGPAWVDWRSTNDYVGWAPLPPEENWNWGNEWRPSRSYYSDMPSAYVFVPQRYFGTSDMRSYTVRSDRNRALLANARNMTIYRTHNNHVRNEGPRRDMIEQALGRRIESARYEPHSINGRRLPVPIDDRGISRERRIATVRSSSEVTSDVRRIQEQSNEKVQRSAEQNRAHEENRNRMIEANRHEREALDRSNPAAISREHRPSHEREMQVTRERSAADVRVQQQNRTQQEANEKRQNTKEKEARNRQQQHDSARVAPRAGQHEAKPKRQETSKRSDAHVDQPNVTDHDKPAATNKGKGANAHKKKHQDEHGAAPSN